MDDADADGHADLSNLPSSLQSSASALLGDAGHSRKRARRADAAQSPPFGNDVWMLAASEGRLSEVFRERLNSLGVNDDLFSGSLCAAASPASFNSVDDLSGAFEGVQVSESTQLPRVCSKVFQHFICTLTGCPAPVCLQLIEELKLYDAVSECSLGPVVALVKRRDLPEPLLVSGLQYLAALTGPGFFRLPKARRAAVGIEHHLPAIVGCAISALQRSPENAIMCLAGLRILVDCLQETTCRQHFLQSPAVPTLSAVMAAHSTDTNIQCLASRVMERSGSLELLTELPIDALINNLRVALKSTTQTSSTATPAASSTAATALAPSALALAAPAAAAAPVGTASSSGVLSIHPYGCCVARSVRLLSKRLHRSSNPPTADLPDYVVTVDFKVEHSLPKAGVPALPLHYDARIISPAPPILPSRAAASAAAGASCRTQANVPGSCSPHGTAAPSDPARLAGSSAAVNAVASAPDSRSLWEWLVESSWLVPSAFFYVREEQTNGSLYNPSILRPFSDALGDVLENFRTEGVAALYAALPHSVDAGSMLLCSVAARPELLRDHLQSLGGMQRLLDDAKANVGNGRAHRVLLFLQYFLIRSCEDEQCFIDAGGLACIWDAIRRCYLPPIGPESDYDEYGNARLPDDYPLQADEAQLAELKMHLEVLHHLVGTHLNAADRFRRSGLRAALENTRASRQSDCYGKRACKFHILCAAWSSIWELESSILFLTTEEEEFKRALAEQREFELSKQSLLPFRAWR